MDIIKICECCGVEFVAKRKNARFCSEKCKNKQYRLDNKEYHKQWRLNNKEYHKQWHLNNKERHYQYNKQWRLNNKERTKQYFKQYRLDNKERRKEYNKQWRLDNKERTKQYYLNNKERILKLSNEYRKQRKKKDPNYKMSLQCRQFVYRCLNSEKTKHTFDILGYTPEMLKQRLEMNFKSDMNWSNHGTLWHIDHVKPLCKFNFVLPDGTPDYEQIRLANSLANLKPLYIQENLSKGGR